jgi:hypothetical protein
LGGVSSGYIVKIEDDQRTHVQFVTIHALTMEGANFDSLESLNSNEEYHWNSKIPMSQNSNEEYQTNL